MRDVMIYFSRYQMPILLGLLLLGNFILRFIFEIQLHPVPFYFDQLGIDVQNSAWYTYLIPSNAKLWGGTMASFSIGILPLLHKLIGNTNTYLLLNLLFISVTYILSWYAFRSRILTFTIGLCAAFTTLNDHVYDNGSLVALYIPLIFCFFNLFTILKLFQVERPQQIWWFLWFLSLFFYIASFEGWVDYYASIIILSPALFFLLKKNRDLIRFKRFMLLLAYMTLAFIPFLYVKINYVYASHIGEEHDLVFNYGPQYWVLIVEDLISNFFTFFYTTIITYLPQQLTFSNALLKYGAQSINNLQNGYEGWNANLALINALLLWRFYAGVFLSIFLYYFWKVCRSLFNNFQKELLYLFIFMSMILISSPAHLLVKYRTFHLIPWLSYQPFIGQVGLILLIPYSLFLLHQSAISKRIIWTISILVWSSIVLSAFTKPPFFQLGKASGHLPEFYRCNN